MITPTTGAMLRVHATGDLLPVQALVFDQGGAVSGIVTTEDEHGYYDADVLSCECSIELIRIGRARPVTCPACSGRGYQDGIGVVCLECLGHGEVTKAHAEQIRIDSATKEIPPCQDN